jgi:hypothetical protein
MQLSFQYRQAVVMRTEAFHKQSVSVEKDVLGRNTVQEETVRGH